MGAGDGGRGGMHVQSCKGLEKQSMPDRCQTTLQRLCQDSSPSFDFVRTALPALALSGQFSQLWLCQDSSPALALSGQFSSFGFVRTVLQLWLCQDSSPALALSGQFSSFGFSLTLLLYL